MSAHVLVLGRSGQLAQALTRAHGARITALGRETLDLSAPDFDIAGALAAYRPAAVINAAAYTAVDKAESEEADAFALNHRAPALVAEACARAGAPLVHVSTDYVYDGEKDAPYVETDATAPLNAYGRSKLAGEDAVRASGARAAIVRTAWVYAAQGGNFMRTMLRLAETQDEVRVVADQRGAPTLADDLADACITAALRLAEGDAAAQGVFHFSSAGETTWADYAQEIFARAGKATRISRITTAEYPTPARRPRNSRLDCSKIRDALGVAQPDWREALARCLKMA